MGEDSRFRPVKHSVVSKILEYRQLMQHYQELLSTQHLMTLRVIQCGCPEALCALPAP